MEHKPKETSRLSRDFIFFVIAFLFWAQVTWSSAASSEDKVAEALRLAKPGPKLLRRGIGKDERILQEGLGELNFVKKEGVSDLGELNGGNNVGVGRRRVSIQESIDYALGVDGKKNKMVLGSSSGQLYKKPKLEDGFLQPRSIEFGHTQAKSHVTWDYLQSKGNDGWKDDDLLLGHWRAQGFNYKQRQMATLLGEALEVWSPVYLMDPKVSEELDLGRLTAGQSTALRYHECYRSSQQLKDANKARGEFPKVLIWFKALMGDGVVAERLRILESEGHAALAELPGLEEVDIWRSSLLHEHPELINGLKKEYPVNFLLFLKQRMTTDISDVEKSMILETLILTALRSDHVWNCPDMALIFLISSALEVRKRCNVVQRLLASSPLFKLRSNLIRHAKDTYVDEWRELILDLKAQMPGQPDNDKLMKYCVYLESAHTLDPGSFERLMESFQGSGITRDLIEELAKQGTIVAISKLIIDVNLANFSHLPLPSKTEGIEAAKNFLGRMSSFQKEVQDLLSERMWVEGKDFQRAEYKLLYDAKEVIKSWFERYYEGLPLKSSELGIPARTLLTYHTEFLEMCRMFENYPNILDQTLTAVARKVGARNVQLTQSLVSGALEQRKMSQFSRGLRKGGLGLKPTTRDFKDLIDIEGALDFRREYAVFSHSIAIKEQQIYDVIAKNCKEYMASILGEVYVERERLLYMSSKLVPNRMVRDQETDVLVRKLMEPDEAEKTYRKGISPTRRVALQVTSRCMKQSVFPNINDLRDQWGIDRGLLQDLSEKLKSPGYESSIEYELFWEELQEPKPSIKSVAKHLKKILASN